MDVWKSLDCKKIGKAVIRNKIKRQVRSMCDKLIDFQSNSFDIVIVIRKNYLELDPTLPKKVKRTSTIKRTKQKDVDNSND